MSKDKRARRNNAQKEDSMTTETATAVVHESKKVKAITGEGVKSEVQKVDAKFGSVEGSINYPRVTALTVAGALLIAQAHKLTKDGPNDKDGKPTEVEMTDEEKFLKYFNAGYDAAMRITARNELAVLIEGPEKQINAVALRIAKIKGLEGTEEDMIKKVKALPEFATLVAVMS